MTNRFSGATYASMPMIGLTGEPEATFWNSYAPNMLPWSLIAIAGISSRSASLNSGFSFAAPSSMLYSVCTCRCTKDLLTRSPNLRPGQTYRMSLFRPSPHSERRRGLRRRP
ncbi:hypothetical protein GCM10020001_062970 [Nonomuraea salmonea]